MITEREAAFAKYRDEQLGGVGGNWDGLDAAHFRDGFDAGYNARGEAGWMPIRTVEDLPPVVNEQYWVTDHRGTVYSDRYNGDTLFWLRFIAAESFRVAAQTATQLADAKAEIKRLREALEHYADKKNWLCPDDRHNCQDDDCYHDKMWLDEEAHGYDIARQALEHVKESE